MARRWKFLQLSELTPAEHRQFSVSLRQTEAFIRAMRSTTPADKRRRTMAANLVAQIRRDLAATFGDVYADPLQEEELAVDLDVWGKCIEGLEL